MQKKDLVICLVGFHLAEGEGVILQPLYANFMENLMIAMN